MADPFREARAGDQLDIPAAAFNAWQRSAKAFEASRLSRRGGPQGTAGDADRILLKNDSGGDVDRFNVLAFREPVITDADALDVFQDRPILSGETPATDDAGKFAVLLEPAGAGDVAVAQVSGVIVVKVDDGDGTTGFCDVADGVSDSLAFQAGGSARVLWRAAGTGKQWAVVLLGSSGESMGQYQYQSRIMVAQNQPGWDFDSLHPPVI